MGRYKIAAATHMAAEWEPFYLSATAVSCGDSFLHASPNGVGDSGIGSIIHKSVYIRSRLHVCHYGLRFKITRQVGLKVPVNCSVATSNDACY